jgi:tetratricopeptide (TPR) repeat protein
MRRACRLTVVCLLLVDVLACRQTPIEPAALPTLPDLTGLDQSLQQQVHTEYEALERAARNGSPQQVADAHGRVGKILLAAERYQGAEPFFTSAASLNTTDMRWPYYLGHVYRLLQQPEKAAALFEQARRLDPRHMPSLIWLGEMYLALGRPADAEPHLTVATELQPSSAAAWFHRGRAALAKGDHRRAVSDLEHARALDPRAEAIDYQLGLAYRALGDAKAAAYLKHRADAASIVPDDPLMNDLQAGLQSGAAYLTRGLEAIERRDWPDAVSNLRKATELSPRDPTAHLNLGTALFISGDRPGARTAFETAIRLAPEVPKPRFTLGLLAESELKDAEAIEQFTTAVRLDPNYLEARASLADALRRTGQVEASLPHYQKVLSIDPSASYARLGYGMGLVRLGRYREARGWFEEAAALHPEQPGFGHALARVLAAAPDERVRDGRRAMALTDALIQSNRSWTLLETRAMAAAELGDFDTAIKSQQAAIDEASKTGQREAVSHMQTILALYRRGMPCRTPWRANDPVHAPRPSA